MYRALSPNVLTYSVGRLLLATILVGLSVAACASVPSGTPPPPCSLNACEELENLNTISTGLPFTRGWALGKNENGDLIIGRWRDHPSGFAHVEWDESHQNLLAFSLTIDDRTSAIPKTLLSCITGTAPDKVAWVVTEIDDPRWGGAFRRLLIGFSDTDARLKNGAPPQINNQSYVQIDFSYDQLTHVTYFLADDAYISASGNTGCPQDLVPVKY